MKLRIRGNSLRIRVVRAELDVLREQGAVSDAIVFPDGRRLSYGLQVSQGETALAARFEGDAIVIAIPSALAGRWYGEREVGLEGEQTLPDGQILRLLIEKDFPCLTVRPGEDDSDAFARPR